MATGNPTTVPAYCEGNDSPFDKRTWIEKMKHIAELNRRPITLSKDQPVPVFKQGDAVVVRYPRKGKVKL